MGLLIVTTKENKIKKQYEILNGTGKNSDIIVMEECELKTISAGIFIL
ncbi:hypothetical protein KAS50_05120 [bacterium]|nr:hypothetical protein [bacterium]